MTTEFTSRSVKDIIYKRVAQALDSTPITDELAARFKSCLLDDPEEANVTLADFRASYLKMKPGNYAVLLVVKDDPQSVFFDPNTGLYGACWGPDIYTGETIDLGFRSDNPAEMYLA